MNFGFLYRHPPFLLASILLLTGSLVARGETYELQIEPVGWERTNVPVIVEIPLPAGQPEAPWAARLVGADGSERTAQLEILETNGEKSLCGYWVEPQVEKEVAPTFTLTISAGNRRGRPGPLFAFRQEEDFQELSYGERPVYRYITVYDPERHGDTDKPHHQIYQFGADGFITKGPGGQYPHHKGIFLGWSKTRVSPRGHHDFWQTPRAYQQHNSYLREREMTGPVVARAVSTTDWKTPAGKAVVRDTREVWTWAVAEDELLLDFVVTIQPLGGDIVLDGDAHHAGFQFRASQEVAENAEASVVIAPAEAQSLPNDNWSGASWMAMSFDVAGSPYTVVHMDHPENPEETVYSTRNYGRFGAFVVSEVREGDSLVLRYRILIKGVRDHPSVTRESISGRHADYEAPPVVRVTKK